MYIRTLLFVVMLLLFCTPFLTHAQQASDAVQAVTDAKSDHKTHWGKYANWVYLGAGFTTSLFSPLLCGMPTALVSLFIPAHLPTNRFIGKSPEYVLIYTQTYQREAKSQQFQYATIGCLGGCIVNFAILLPFYMDYYQQP